MFAVFGGIAIGFYFNWKVSLVCLGCVPFMIIGGAMNAKFQKGMSHDTEEAMKEANLLAGDSIINYRTVASFANEDQIVRDFDAMLEAPVKTATNKSHLMGVTFGFSQFVQYGVYAIMFYAAALFLQKFIDEKKDEKDPFILFEIIDYSQSVFIAIFSMMMGAMSAG